MAILELISTLQLILVLRKMDIDTTYIPSYIKTFKRFLFLCADHCGREEAKGEEGQASNSWRPPLLEVTAPVLKDARGVP